LEALDKSYPAVDYAVGREKIREFAAATGETDPLCFDLDAARAAGYPDLVAPPMFAVVYASRALVAGLFDPEVGIDFGRMVHGAQEFVWGPVVLAGDEITTVATFTEHRESAGMAFFGFRTISTNVKGVTVCTGSWTNIVRSAR
jgi:acyl dehydratase